MPNKKITKIKTIEEIKKSLADSVTGYDSGYILRKAETTMVTENQ
jgi:hypothetical protein